MTENAISKTVNEMTDAEAYRALVEKVHPYTPKFSLPGLNLAAKECGFIIEPLNREVTEKEIDFFLGTVVEQGAVLEAHTLMRRIRAAVTIQSREDLEKVMQEVNHFFMKLEVVRKEFQEVLDMPEVKQILQVPKEG